MTNDMAPMQACISSVTFIKDSVMPLTMLRKHTRIHCVYIVFYAKFLWIIAHSSEAEFSPLLTISQVQPISLCNEHCRSGYSKKVKEGEPFCCYECIPCPEGEISNRTGES